MTVAVEGWTLSEARCVIRLAKAALPGWRIALHRSVLDATHGRDLDLLVLLPEGASPDTLGEVMGAVDTITSYPGKRRFRIATGQVVDARIVAT